MTIVEFMKLMKTTITKNINLKLNLNELILH